jgi:hypothetical protein
MIICVCRNIKQSDFKDGKITKEEYDEYMNNMQCGSCSESWIENLEIVDDAKIS